MKKPRKPIPPFPNEQLEAICKIIAETSTGLTGSEIGHTLAKCGIRDVDPTSTKWKRLHNAFAAIENSVQHGNHVVAFLHKAMSPVLYADSAEHFERKRAELNRVLAFSGLGKSGTPVLAINSLSTDTERGEQRGFMNLLIGLFGTFRNPTAHAPKIYWPIDEQDALDILSLVSLVHRKLEKVRKP